MSWSAMRAHCAEGMIRLQYAMAAIHSESIDGSPKAGPQTCSSNTILREVACQWAIGDREPTLASSTQKDDRQKKTLTCSTRDCGMPSFSPHNFGRTSPRYQHHNDCNVHLRHGSTKAILENHETFGP